MAGVLTRKGEFGHTQGELGKMKAEIAVIALLIQQLTIETRRGMSRVSP